MRPKGQNIGTQVCIGNLRGTVAALNNIYYFLKYRNKIYNIREVVQIQQEKKAI